MLSKTSSLMQWLQVDFKTLPRMNTPAHFGRIPNFIAIRDSEGLEKAKAKSDTAFCNNQYSTQFLNWK